MYQGWSLNWPNTRCFFLPNEWMSWSRHQLLLPWPKKRKKPPQKTHKTKNKKNQLFFESKVQFFWRDLLQSFIIPKEDFSVARGQSLSHSFRWGYFFRGQCSVRAIFGDQFYCGWITFSGEWRGITFWGTAFDEISFLEHNPPWKQFSMGVIFIGVTLHEREFYRWAAIYFEIFWW